MKRELRYCVLKHKDIEGALSDTEKRILEELTTKIQTYRESRGKTDEMECVVVEHDWPEYEIVWRMIEDRVDGVEPKMRTMIFEKKPPKRSVYCVEWTEYEYEPGWGASQRPDGISLHITCEAAEAFIKVRESKGDHDLFWRAGKIKTVGVSYSLLDEIEDKTNLDCSNLRKCQLINDKQLML